MTPIDQLLYDQDVGGARAALVDLVRREPQNQAARMFLFQLLAVLGEWDKAASALKALATLSPEAQMLSVVYGQVLEAEKVRAAAFRGQAEFPLLFSSAPWAATLTRSLGAFSRGETAQGEVLREEAFGQADEAPGVCDGQAFGWIADVDPRFGPTFEAIIGPRWGLITFEEVSAITSEGPGDLRDLVWLPVQISFKNGQGAAGFLPVRYPGSEQQDGGARLARSTQWDGVTGQGLGQRIWMLDTEQEIGLLGFRALSFQ